MFFILETEEQTNDVLIKQLFFDTVAARGKSKNVIKTSQKLNAPPLKMERKIKPLQMSIYLMICIITVTTKKTS